MNADTSRRSKPPAPRNHAGRLRLFDFVITVGLLIAPALAGRHLLGGNAHWFILSWYATASSLTYYLYADDKRRAQTGAWRSPETMLHVFELAGGWPGALLAQRRLRHKSSKLSYQFTFWLIVAAHQFVAIDFLLAWRLSRALYALGQTLLSRLT